MSDRAMAHRNLMVFKRKNRHLYSIVFYFNRVLSKFISRHTPYLFRFNLRGAKYIIGVYFNKLAHASGEFPSSELARQICFARREVKFYEYLYSKIDLSFIDQKKITIEQFKRLPIISKEDMQGVHIDDITPTSLTGERRSIVSTGGTSGNIFRFSQDVWMRNQFFNLAISHIWKNYGFNFSYGSLDLNAPYLDGGMNFSRRYNRLYISQKELSQPDFDKFLPEIRAFSPRFLLAIPSSACLFLDRMKAYGETLKNLEFIIVGSEELFEREKIDLEEYFGCPVKQWYGHSESSAFAYQCAKTGFYHFDGAFGFTEILGSDSKQVKPGVDGEIVVSGFYPDGTPFVRYRTGDLAKYFGNSCPGCGFKGVVVNSIRGRRSEVIYDSNGSQLPLSVFNVHDDEFTGVRRFQLVQKQNGIILVRLLRDPSSDLDQDKIREFFSRQLGEAFSVEVGVVEKLQQTERGKTPILIRRP